MRSKKSFGYVLVVVALALVFMACVSGCGRKQHVSFRYDFAISPKKDQVLKDVTVYLPFPTKDGKPIREIYESLMRDYNKYWADDHPNARVSLENTEYGTMLKISIPEVDQRGFGLEGGYGFEEAYTEEKIAPHYMLAPRKDVKRLSHLIGYVADTYVYADFKGGDELGLALEYDISILSPPLFPLDYVPEDGYTAYLGFDEPPIKPGNRVKYVKRKGWTKMKLADNGYDKESYGQE